jgi:hypothetical protein
MMCYRRKFGEMGVSYGNVAGGGGVIKRRL